MAGAPLLDGIHHLKLPVTDLDRSLAWYQQRLGYEILHRVRRGRRRDGHRDAAPQWRTRPGAAVRPGRPVPRARGIDYFAIGVPGHDAIEELADRFTEMDDPHDGVQRTPVGWVLTGVSDPDGHTVRFYTVPLEVPPDAG